MRLAARDMTAGLVPKRQAAAGAIRGKGASGTDPLLDEGVVELQIVNPWRRHDDERQERPRDRAARDIVGKAANAIASGQRERGGKRPSGGEECIHPKDGAKEHPKEDVL